MNRGERLITMRLSGVSAEILDIYQNLRSRLPAGPRGGCKYTCSIKENVDGVTSRLYINLPSEAFSAVLAGRNISTPSAAPIQPNHLSLSTTADMVYEADVVEIATPGQLGPRYRLGYCGQ